LLTIAAAAGTTVPAAWAAGVSPDDRGYARSGSAATAAVRLGPDDRRTFRGASTILLPGSSTPDDRLFARSTRSTGAA